MNYGALIKKDYERDYDGYSVMGDAVKIVGEAKDTVNGNEYYFYDILGYTPVNGQPFVALKANIIPTEPIME